MLSSHESHHIYYLSKTIQDKIYRNKPNRSASIRTASVYEMLKKTCLAFPFVRKFFTDQWSHSRCVLWMVQANRHFFYLYVFFIFDELTDKGKLSASHSPTALTKCLCELSLPDELYGSSGHLCISVSVHVCIMVPWLFHGQLISTLFMCVSKPRPQPDDLHNDLDSWILYSMLCLCMSSSLQPPITQ